MIVVFLFFVFLLAEGILDVVGVLIQGGYILDNMLNEVVMGRYLRAFVAVRRQGV